MLPLCVPGGAPGLPAACVGASLQSQLSSEGVEAETTTQCPRPDV